MLFLPSSHRFHQFCQCMKHFWNVHACVCVCVCVCAHAYAFKDQPNFILFKSLALVTWSRPTVPTSSPSSLPPCPQCYRHTCLLLVSVAHEAHPCLGLLQQLFPLSEMLVLHIFLFTVGTPLSVRSYLNKTSSGKLSLITQPKSHLIMCSAIAFFNFFHWPNLNKSCISSIPRKVPGTQQVLRAYLLNTLKRMVDPDLYA